MARIIGGSPLGMLSGKLGGNVFSHNKGGQYVRQYVIPVNPDSTQQLQVRSRFGMAVATYHSLTSEKKAMWQAYANGVFSPKVGINHGQFSGFNAFAALRNMVTQARALDFDVTVTANGSALTTPATFSEYMFNSIPPSFGVEPAIAEQTTNDPIYFDINQLAVFTNGAWALTLGLSGAATGVGYDIEDFKDTHDNKISFMVQLSNGNPQEGMFYNNKYLYTLGFVKPMSWDADDRAGVESIEIECESGISVSKYHAFPTNGQYCYASVWVVNPYGGMICIGGKEGEITPPAI